MLDIRFGAQIGRMRTAERRMRECASGELEDIAEMERVKLPYMTEREWLPIVGEGEGRIGRFGSWCKIVTPEFLGW